MKSIRPLALTLLPALALFSLPALAQYMPRSDVEMVYTHEKPLITVRFNQRNVMFERSLYSAVSKAVAAKPSVMFDVVVAAPSYGTGSNKERQAQAAANAGGRFMKTMGDMGVPQSRMTYQVVPDSGTEFPEVRLFVR